MMLFLLSEGTFFAFLIIAYVYYHAISHTGVVMPCGPHQALSCVVHA